MIGGRELTEIEQNLEEERVFKINRFKKARAIINRQSERDTFSNVTAAGAGVGFLAGLGLGITAALTTFVPSFGLSVFAIPVFALAGAIIGGVNNLAVAGLLNAGSKWLSKRANNKPPQQAAPPKLTNVKIVPLKTRPNSNSQNKDLLPAPPKPKNIRLISRDTLENYLSCVISFEVMKKPVIFPGGLAYDKSSIKAFWQKRDGIDPIINQESSDDYTLLSDHTLLAIISDFNSQNAQKKTFTFFSKKAQSNVNENVPAGQFPMRAIKPHLKCPITGKIMTDPVVASDGYTYERSAIWELMTTAGEGYGVSPKTKQPFAHQLLIDNQNIKAILKLYQQLKTKKTVEDLPEEKLLKIK